MADNNFRGFRGRASFAHEDERDPREALRDPLAELARLIGQADPRQPERNDFSRDARQQPEPIEDTPRALGGDYAAEHGGAKPGRYAGDNKVQPEALDPHLPPPDFPQADGGHRRYQDDARQPSIAPDYAADGDYYDDAQNHENGSYRDDGGYGDEEAPAPQSARSRGLPPLPAQSYDDGYDADDQWQEDADDHGYGEPEYEDDIDEEERPRRRGLTVILAMLMLVGIGAAGAFAYRAVFGGAMLPALPPIIKANDGPNRIPGQATASAQADLATSSTGEQLVSREEQPMPIQPQDAPARAVSTVPVAPAGPSLSSAQAAPDNSPFPPSPITAAPQPASAPPPAIAAEPAGPKKIHTVLIKPDQTVSGGGANTSSGTAPTSPKTKPGSPAKGGNAPLAIVPGGQGAAPAPAAEPPRTQVARAEPAPRAAPAPAASASGGGGFAVQVTSQRSEADAQSAFQALQAKYPDQLGDKQPIIRRADLGEKGIYFRAMIGPYGSRAEATNMCMTLKAAGASCLVQPN